MGAALDAMTDQSTSTDQATARYRLRRELASGGMATVHLADDVVLDRPVALKILAPNLAADAAFVDRFRHEARAAGQLRHPNVVTVYDWGAMDGTWFIAMEYVEGRTLADIIAEDGPLAPNEAAAIAAEIVDALDAAHRQGLVHRDVKPSNIIVTPDGRVKIADFGIARAARGGLDLTQVGMIVGTAAYLSPEQAQGAAVDPRSDLYALGVVLFEMTTGRLPFTSEGALGYATQHVSTPPPRLRTIRPDLPVELDELVDRLLAKDPDHRHQTAADLAVDLRAIAGQGPDAAPPAGTGTGTDLPADGHAATAVMAAEPQDVGTPASVPATELMPQSLRPDQRTDDRIDQGLDRRSADQAPARPPRQGSTRSGLLPIVIAVLVVGVVAALLLLATRIGSSGEDDPADTTSTTATTATPPQGSDTQADPSPVEVPDLSGQSQADAESTLTARDLIPSVEPIDVDDPDQVGRVVSQDPQPGGTVDAGSTVVIRIGRQAETTTTTEPQTTSTADTEPPSTEPVSTTEAPADPSTSG
jgi:eukaryotic-like serine/threonine-protein kinase